MTNGLSYVTTVMGCLQNAAGDQYEAEEACSRSEFGLA